MRQQPELQVREVERMPGHPGGVLHGVDADQRLAARSGTEVRAGGLRQAQLTRRNPARASARSPSAP
ncbi:hypothetical protein ABZ281_20040 [Streptomyces sp. NPDC006265]|uniref:hypothetical protein n=1 Tax=Streptomyces sp. NPDC006265 TaxID=3156740 RepID=UPI0033A693DA